MQPHFPRAEYEIRYKRARELMAERELDALLATNVINYTYLGGHVVPGLAPWTTRPFILLFSMDQEPMIIGQLGAKELMEKTSNVAWLKFWSSLPFNVEVIKDAFDELNLTNGTIGCELGLEERLGISFNDFMELQKNLPQARFIDAAEVFWNLRAEKTQAEVECVKKTCEVTSNAYEQTFNKMQIGMTAEMITELFFDSIIEQGLTPHFNLCRLWSTKNRSLRVKREGVVWLDGGAVYKGYRCDFSRMVAVSVAHKNVSALYEKIRNITWRLIDMVKPGIRVADIANVCVKEYEKAGLSNAKLESIGRIGHGLGLGNGDPYNFSTELPSISRKDPTILRPGMIVTIEPGEKTNYGYFTLEENLLVTENGYELLSEEISDEEIRTIL